MTQDGGRDHGNDRLDVALNSIARTGRGPRLRVNLNWLSGGAHIIIVAVAAQFETVAAWLDALAAMSLVSFAAWIGNYRRLRYISDTPASRVASAAQGYVELMGKAQKLPDSNLLSRLTQTPCTWYRYAIQKRVSNNKWSEVESGESDDPFLVEDATGTCVIDPEGAEIVCSRKNTWTSGSYRNTEWLLLQSDPLYAIGNFATIGGADASLDLKSDVGAMLAEWKKDQPELLKRFDLNRDGKIDLQEWELARRQARRVVESQYREVRAIPGTHVLRCPSDGRLFLISNCTPARLCLQYRLWSLVHIAIFISAGAMAFMMFQGFHFAL